MHQIQSKFPVFVMCGEDQQRRKLLEVMDPECRYKSKALLPFLGKRLIDWQLDELRHSPYVDKIYLVGLSPQDASFDFPVAYAPVAVDANFADKLNLALDYLEKEDGEQDLVVISSCDAPGIRQAEIDAFLAALPDLKGVEFVLSLVPNEVVEAVFPSSGRVIARFSDGEVFPGELMALSPRAIRMGQQIISDFSQRRRKINRTRRRISLGPMVSYLAKRPRTWGLLAKYGLGLATLADAERGFSAAFECQTRGVIIPEAGFGMDMDLPEDYSRLEDYVRKTKLNG